jgi:hypothetical protein
MLRLLFYYAQFLLAGAEDRKALVVVECEECVNGSDEALAQFP